MSNQFSTRRHTHRFCINIYYSVSRGRRQHSTLTHRTRVISPWQWQQWDTTEFPARSRPQFFPDQKALNSRNFWCLMTSRISREALWRCNACAMAFLRFNLPETSGLRKNVRMKGLKLQKQTIFNCDIIGWFYLMTVSYNFTEICMRACHCNYIS